MGFQLILCLLQASINDDDVGHSKQKVNDCPIWIRKGEKWYERFQIASIEQLQDIENEAQLIEEVMRRTLVRNS